MHQRRAEMLALHPQIGRALHLTIPQDEQVRTVIYSALQRLADADALEGLDLKVEDSK